MNLMNMFQPADIAERTEGSKKHQHFLRTKTNRMTMIHTPQITICRLAFGLMLSFLFVGCTFMQLKEEREFSQKSKVLVGNVSSSLSFSDMPVVIAAYSKKDKKRTIVHYTTLHELGPYELIVPIGGHNIVAFVDKRVLKSI